MLFGGVLRLGLLAACFVVARSAAQEVTLVENAFDNWNGRGLKPGGGAFGLSIDSNIFMLYVDDDNGIESSYGVDFNDSVITDTKTGFFAWPLPPNGNTKCFGVQPVGDVFSEGYLEVRLQNPLDNVAFIGASLRVSFDMYLVQDEPSVEVFGVYLSVTRDAAWPTAWTLLDERSDWGGVSTSSYELAYQPNLTYALTEAWPANEYIYIRLRSRRESTGNRDEFALCNLRISTFGSQITSSPTPAPIAAGSPTKAPTAASTNESPSSAAGDAQSPSVTDDESGLLLASSEAEIAIVATFIVGSLLVVALICCCLSKRRTQRSSNGAATSRSSSQRGAGGIEMRGPSRSRSGSSSAAVAAGKQRSRKNTGSRRGTVSRAQQGGGGGGDGASSTQTAFSAATLVEDHKNYLVDYNELELHGEIGRGAYGQVLKGKWRGSRVAVKKLRADDISPAEIDAFVSEASVMANLRPHPNVVALFGIVPPPKLCIILEYCSNGSLYTLLQTDEVIESNTILMILRGIAAGVAHLHNEKIIHRDLAARNVLLDAEQRPKVSDFGMSRLIHTGDGGTTTSNVGPLKYFAPECINHHIFSTKSDVWAFAVVVIECLSRCVEPYEGLQPLQVATKVARGDLRLAAPDEASVGLRVLVDKCQQYDPHDRPSFLSIGGMLNAIKTVFAEDEDRPLDGIAMDNVLTESDNVSDAMRTLPTVEIAAAAGIYDYIGTEAEGDSDREYKATDAILQRAAEKAVEEAGGDIVEPKNNN